MNIFKTTLYIILLLVLSRSSFSQIALKQGDDKMIFLERNLIGDIEKLNIIRAPSAALDSYKIEEDGLLTFVLAYRGNFNCLSIFLAQYDDGKKKVEILNSQNLAFDWEGMPTSTKVIDKCTIEFTRRLSKDRESKPRYIELEWNDKNGNPKTYYMSGTVVIDLETNDQNLNKLIGPYSSIFEDNSSKGNIEIEYYDDNAGTIGVYMWDSYRNNVPESARFSIGDFSYDATILNLNKISFVPKIIKPYRHKGSSSWVEEDLKSIIGKEVKIELTMDSIQILSENINLSPPLEFNILENSANEINRLNAKVTWNKDENNKNGVLIFLKSSGVDSNNVFGKPSKGISKLLLLEDDGEEIIPFDVFEAISTGTYIDLQIWRGNGFTKTTNDGDLFNVLVTSRAIISGVLAN